ncbi:MAG: gliding motility-associated C-terminal domain-containing protein [Chitinophagaceae bacterium]
MIFCLRIATLFFFLLFLSGDALSQQLNWAHQVGGTDVDISSTVYTDNAGNVYIAGKFSGTNVDFDPSAAVFPLSSVGFTDAFVAKYTANGQFIWAFRFGGANRDDVASLATDQNGNLYITGYFRGANIDFDPGAGVANLTSNGDAGIDPEYGGDIFIAKYNTAGQYQWAFNIGGFELYDTGISIATDAAGNVYAGGYFTNTADFDPSGGVAFLNSAVGGTIFLAKYTTNGAYQWAFNLGDGTTNNSPFDVKVDAAGNVYATGYFRGLNIDFDPSAAFAPLYSNGGYEIFVAKYNTNGQYQFAFSVGSTGLDVGRGLALDNGGNIYLTGDFNGTVDFDPGPGTAMLTSHGQGDAVLAKYSSTGQYLWAFNFGGTPNEYGEKVIVDGGHVFVTGSFSGTADFDPSARIDNLTSAGGYDIYLGKYTLNGEYLCSFRIGSSGDDGGYSLVSNAPNVFYLTGAFTGANIDFDPTTATSNLSSAGSNDIFLAKYTWPDNARPTGYLAGDNICAGIQAKLTFNATAGTGPFTVVYNNGTANIQQTNVLSGVPFNITPNPAATTTYTLVSVRDALRCSETNFISGTATVNVTNCAPDFTIPDTVCVNTPVNITNTTIGVTSYYWSFCAADANKTPTAVNLGNPGGSLSLPVFSDVVNDNGNYYVFVSNNWPGGLVRLDFGNSLLNAPVVVNLGNVGGIIPNTIEGIQVVKNEGRWYAIMVGGDFATGGIPSRIIKIDFGVNITNLVPVGTNWGNKGNLAYPVDLHLFQENGGWYGFTVNAQNNTITRFNFSNSFNNVPIGVNLGNLGGLNYPTGINAVKDNGNWYVFITNDVVNSFLVRLNFGNSLLNVPTAVNLGNPGNVLHKTRDIYVMKACDKITALAVNGDGYNDLVKLDFNNNITSTPTGTSLGNTGNMNFPHSLSRLFRVGNDLYGFVTNVNNNTITRIRFEGCTNSSIPNSTLQTPPAITYSTPGTYNINLTVDEGLATQTSFCKQIVVKDCTVPTIPDFDIPDTVCVNTPVTITNKTVGATSHYWNFCSGDINKTPTATNLGNIGGLLSQPVFMDYAFYNGNYYGFSINHYPGKLVRLNFGNSLLNVPTATDLGNFGGIIPPGYGSEGIQIVQNEGKWYAIIVGGYTPSGSTPRILKIDFGADLADPAPVATDWGNIGNMLQPLDLHVFKEGNNWYGLTINAENNSVTRFSFTNSFDNVPTAVNLGGFGMLDYPTGIYAINDNGFWRVFITNNGSNSRLVRLDVGTSLLNTPTAVNLGSIGNTNGLRDLTILKYCDQVAGFAVNATTNSLYRLNFATLTSIPTVTNLGNIGNLNIPHSISKLFRVNDNLYGFITNVGNNTITRLQFAGCTNSNPANSALQNPPPVVYNAPGTYNINLTIDDGLPTQSSACKQVVVMPALVHKPIQNIVICDGNSIKIGSSSAIGSYQWNNGATTDSIVVNTNGIYWVEANRFGCVNRDSFDVTVALPVNVELGNDKIVCLPDNLILDAGNAGSVYLWSNGSTNQTITVNSTGVYYVRVTRNGCVSSDTVRVTAYSISSFDFNYKQNVCDPLSVQFSGIGTSLTNSYWDFGDDIILTNTANAVHLFPSAGNYIVKYSIGNGICSDTIRKTISINTTWDNLILTPDTTMCNGGTKQLRTVPSLSFCWSPVTYLDNPNSPSPITSTPQDITYYFTAEVTGANLITNGDFSLGNSGFTSQYNFANPNTTEAQYFVGANPASWNAGLSTCKDHSSGNGNMLLVNGSPMPNVTVWKQTVNVMPNTNYAFSTWIQALFTPNPAQLQFSINGKDIGPLITANLPTCTWSQFYTTWNSGDSTQAVISIVNKNTQVQGNDFALDDISFAPVFIKRDSVIIRVEHPVVKTNADTTICAGTAVQLNATGAQNYSWSPAAGLTNTAIANPVATPAASSQYIVAGKTINGCIAKDTVNINVFTKPAITTSNDTLVCKNGPVRLLASGGTSYNWSPAATLNNPFISNPVASPVINTKYYVVVKDINTCEYRDSVEVTIRPDAFFAVNNPSPVCRFDSVQLIASGGNKYIWQIAEGLSNTSISNPKASPSVTTDYSVTITENTCNESKTLVTRVTVMPLPLVNAAKANDIDCRNDRSQLLASGATQYVWTPAVALSDTRISNPVAKPAITTQYIVTGTAANGCSAKDTLEVVVYPKPAIVTSNDTTICKSTKVQLNVSGGFSYSWSPAATLNNPLVANPIASPLVSTKYYVLVRDPINCEYPDSVEVAIRPGAAFSINGPTQVCKNESVQLNASGGDTYSWLPAGALNNAAIPNPLASPASTTDYMVTITENTCNETTTLTTRLTVLPSVTINATKSNDLDCSNDRSQLLATGADIYTWSPATTLTNPAIYNPVAMPSTTTEYIVEGTDASGCKGYDTIAVKVDNTNKSSYLMPNAFTPNDDGMNDCYGIKYWGVIDALEFSIYNRWGERIFYSKNPGQCWDGTYKGVKQNGGVYVYMIKAKTNCQSGVFRKGTFVLVR